MIVFFFLFPRKHDHSNCLQKRQKLHEMSNPVNSCIPRKMHHVKSCQILFSRKNNNKKKSYVSSAEITKIVRVVSLATCLLVFIFIPTKYYQSMFKDVKVMECTWMSLRTDGGCYVDRYIPRTYWSGVEKGSSCPSIRSG